MRQIIVVSVACVCIRINPIRPMNTHTEDQQSVCGADGTAPKFIELPTRTLFSIPSSACLLSSSSVHRRNTVLVCTRRWTGILWIIDWDIYLARNNSENTAGVAMFLSSTLSMRPRHNRGWGGAIKLALHFTLFYIRVQKNLIENNTPAVRWTLFTWHAA